MIYTSLNPEKALIWRIIHRDNLPWVLDNGLHCGNSAVKAPGWVHIGNPEFDRQARPASGAAATGRFAERVCAVLLHAVFSHGAQHPHRLGWYSEAAK